MAKDDICILLTSVGGLGGKGIIDSLRLVTERNMRIVSADVENKLLLKHVSDAFYTVPRGNSAAFLEVLIELCEKERVDVVMPGSANDVFALSRDIAHLLAREVFPTVPKFTSLEKLKNKGTTYEFLKRNNLPVPDFYLVKSKDEFEKSVWNLGYPRKPVCFKPADYSISGGARGFRVIKPDTDYADVIFRDRSNEYIALDTVLLMMESYENLPELLVMEYLPGPEYSVYCLAKHGASLYCIPNLREKLQLFYSFEAVVERNEEVAGVCKEAIKALELDYNVNIQLRYSEDGVPKIEEINPRIGGTVVLPVAAGVNLPYFGAKLALGEEIPLVDVRFGTRMIRYWQELFVYHQETFELSSFL